jgi:hypothetical protein
METDTPNRIQGGLIETVARAGPDLTGENGMTKFVEHLLRAVAFGSPALVIAVIVAAILVWGVKR